MAGTQILNINNFEAHARQRAAEADAEARTSAEAKEQEQLPTPPEYARLVDLYQQISRAEALDVSPEEQTDALMDALMDMIDRTPGMGDDEKEVWRNYFAEEKQAIADGEGPDTHFETHVRNILTASTRGRARGAEQFILDAGQEAAEAAQQAEKVVQGEHIAGWIAVGRWDKVAGKGELLNDPVVLKSLLAQLPARGSDRLRETINALLEQPSQRAADLLQRAVQTDDARHRRSRNAERSQPVADVPAEEVTTQEDDGVMTSAASVSAPAPKVFGGPSVVVNESMQVDVELLGIYDMGNTYFEQLGRGELNPADANALMEAVVDMHSQYASYSPERQRRVLEQLEALAEKAEAVDQSELDGQTQQELAYLSGIPDQLRYASAA